MAARQGRQSLLTPQVQERIMQAVTLGMPLRFAAEYGGVSQDTMLDWIQRGEGRSRRRSTPEYEQFAAAYHAAHAQGIMTLHSTIVSAALKGDWRAAGWLLERTEPEYAPPRGGAAADAAQTPAASDATIAWPLQWIRQSETAVQEIFGEVRQLRGLPAPSGPQQGVIIDADPN